MSTPLDDETFTKIQSYGADKRYQYLVKQVAQNSQVWILKDEHGCVMLNSDDEDCVPIWPHKEFAEAWATEEWEVCQAEAIELDVWLSRWTRGLLDDDIAIAAFPDGNSEGLVVFPDEFEEALSKA
ncbi:DUF2750 domain-containing protein [Alteromonadaceae bacterium M269]|nr:DUF2750 domain-containing protein [Alteromonadaceae bacterium M269]